MITSRRRCVSAPNFGLGGDAHTVWARVQRNRHIGGAARWLPLPWALAAAPAGQIQTSRVERISDTCQLLQCRQHDNKHLKNYSTVWEIND